MAEERHAELSLNLAAAAVLGAVFSFMFSGGDGRTAAFSELTINFAQGFGAYAAVGLFAKQFGLDDPGHGVVPLGGSFLVAACFFTLHAAPAAFASPKSAGLAFVGMFLAWTLLSAVVITLAHGCAWLARKFDLFSADA
ncbi:MAG TPA: hypothetical protein VER32_06260 [Pyrinomonadaceae bacterium]|nr:hypothetical protein [Pyrinomonadaceae bacterium]